jgi:peptidoglycan-associated lipoprotein
LFAARLAALTLSSLEKLKNLQPTKNMKLAKIVLPLVLPLAIMLMTTGCPRHNTPPITKINKPVVSPPTTPQPEQNLDTKPLMPTEQPPVATPAQPPYTGGQIETTATWDPKDYTIDKEKLAAYTVHFKFDSAVVEDSEQASVTSVAEALKGDANARLMIEGHCDERGTEQYNMSLGERRALALREALAKVGVDASRIRTISYGKNQPVDSAHNEEAWTKNRRGQFDWCTPKNPAP